MTSPPAAALALGERPKRADLPRWYGATVADLLPDGPLRLLFVGINPGLWTAAVATHFASPGNRFYPALYLAGITSTELSFVTGMSPQDRAELTDRGIGISNVVAVATARADELSAQDYLDGGARLVARVERLRPAVVAVAGITAYRAAFGRRRAMAGEQDDPPGPGRWFVVPNPSGLNAHASVASLARDYRVAAEAAGLTLDPPRWDRS